jgi:hypothetical protein
MQMISMYANDSKQTCAVQLGMSAMGQKRTSYVFGCAKNLQRRIGRLRGSQMGI